MATKRLELGQVTDAHGVKDRYCNAREKTVKSFVYHCREKDLDLHLCIVETFQESCKSIIIMLNLSSVIRCWRRSAIGARRGDFREVASLSLFSFAILCL